MPIAELHHVGSGGVEIENWKPGRKRLFEGFATRRSRRIVKLGATKIVDGRHA
jgi:hypothetical protein